jgi:coiled-coil domain-containing protein 55
MMSTAGDKLAYGLNSRDSSNNSKKKKKKKAVGLTGFDGRSGSSDDDVDEPNNNDNALSVKKRTASSSNSGRDAVNRAIVAEQAALRHRVSAIADATDGVNYDYDAEYDSFSTTPKTNEVAGDDTTTTASSKVKAKPRYITSLLQTAQRRNREHEVVHERKIIHEQQQQQEETEEYEGKERIITQSYKRKLEEREHWAKEEAERTRLEEFRDRQLKESCNKGGYMTNSLMLGIVGRKLLTMDNSKNNEQCTTTTTNDRNQGVERELESVVGVTHDRICTTVNYSNSSSSHRPTATQLKTHPAASSSSSSVPAIASATVNGTLGQMKTREDTTNNVTSSTLKEETTATTTMMQNNKSRQEILVERAIKLKNARKRYYERREKEKRVGST